MTTMLTRTQNNALSARPQARLMQALLFLKAIPLGILLVLICFFGWLRSAVQVAFSKLMGVPHRSEVIVWKGFPSVLDITPADNMDFDFWRKPSYILPTLSAMNRYFLDKLYLDQRVTLADDSDFHFWMTHGPLSRLVKAQADMLSIDLTVIADVSTDEGTQLPGLLIQVARNDPMQISMQFAGDDHVYSARDGGLWVLAKLHAQAAISFILPGRFHGNIHFGLPCTAAAVLQTLPAESVLYQLLAPHLRFTLRINNEALRVQRAQDRSKPYAPFPMSGESFVQSIAVDVKEHVVDTAFRAPHWSMQGELPFQRFGQAYYEPIHAFVAQVLEQEDPAVVRAYQQVVAQSVPGFDHVPAADAIATLIWQVSILHSADHHAMSVQMGEAGKSFMAMRLPVPANSQIKAETRADDVVRMACSADARYRAKVFEHTFVIGHKHPLWSNTMDQISYRFQHTSLQQLAHDFRQQLMDTEARLESQGLNICPLRHTFQSICW